VRKALLDANLLVLLVVGAIDRAWIAKHKRTERFAAGDFDLLLEVLGKFNKVESTPHSFAEASNLFGQVGDPVRREIRQQFQVLLKTQSCVEVFVPSDRASENPSFLELGLTDATLAEAVSAGRTLITVDLDLYLWVLRQGHEAINFAHVQEGSWVEN
jgi:hypothetical protein